MCSILFLLQFIILRSPLIFPRGPAGMAGHLYNLLYTNPLAIFCQINMTVASYLILPPYHTTAIPPTLQHGVVMPPYILYATCMPLLHIVCQGRRNHFQLGGAIARLSWRFVALRSYSPMQLHSCRSHSLYQVRSTA